MSQDTVCSSKKRVAEDDVEEPTCERKRTFSTKEFQEMESSPTHELDNPTTIEEGPSFAELPPEIVIRIVDYLPVNSFELMSFSMCCHDWRNVVSEKHSDKRNYTRVKCSCSPSIGRCLTNDSDLTQLKQYCMERWGITKTCHTFNTGGVHSIFMQHIDDSPIREGRIALLSACAAGDADSAKSLFRCLFNANPDAQKRGIFSANVLSACMLASTPELFDMMLEMIHDRLFDPVLCIYSRVALEVNILPDADYAMPFLIRYIRLLYYSSRFHINIAEEGYPFVCDNPHLFIPVHSFVASSHLSDLQFSYSPDGNISLCAQCTGGDPDYDEERSDASEESFDQPAYCPAATLLSKIYPKFSYHTAIGDLLRLIVDDIHRLPPPNTAAEFQTCVGLAVNFDNYWKNFNQLRMNQSSADLFVALIAEDHCFIDFEEEDVVEMVAHGAMNPYISSENFSKMCVLYRTKLVNLITVRKAVMGQIFDRCLEVQFTELILSSKDLDILFHNVIIPKLEELCHLCRLCGHSIGNNLANCYLSVPQSNFARATLKAFLDLNIYVPLPLEKVQFDSFLTQPYIDKLWSQWASVENALAAAEYAMKFGDVLNLKTLIDLFPNLVAPKGCIADSLAVFLFRQPSRVIFEALRPWPCRDSFWFRFNVCRSGAIFTHPENYECLLLAMEVQTNTTPLRWLRFWMEFLYMGGIFPGRIFTAEVVNHIIRVSKLLLNNVPVTRSEKENPGVYAQKLTIALLEYHQKSEKLRKQIPYLQFLHRLTEMSEERIKILNDQDAPEE
jgi:hypothetical protein